MLSRGSSLIDVAFAVCTSLESAGTTAVLTGGSAATFYAPAVYQSLDADFILDYRAEDVDVANVLAALGFVRRRAGDFAHPDTPYTVEFPRGPLAIGSDVIRAWNTERRELGQLLHILTPTDVVRDRFLHYYAYADLSAYASAMSIAVAIRDRIDWKLFIDWAKREASADVSYDISRLRRFLREAGRPRAEWSRV